MEKRIGDTITYFELLEMMKNGNAPETVKFENLLYEAQHTSKELLENMATFDERLREYKGTVISYQVIVEKGKGLENHFLNVDLARSFGTDIGMLMNQEIEVIE